MKHILLVNGHDDSRHILRTALIHEGFRVTDESDSETALETVRRELPDLVILELYLHPIDGQSFMRRLRADSTTREVPIICLTSRVMEADRQSAIDAGADVFLPKPLTPSEVIGRVRDLLNPVPAE